MSTCAKVVNQVTGTAHVVTNNAGAAVFRAIQHLFLNGQQNCTGTCDTGTCTFALTGLTGDPQIVQDADGTGLTASVSGSGVCYCKT